MIRNIVRTVIALVFGGIGFYIDLMFVRFKLLSSLGVTFTPAWNYILMSLLIILFGIIGFLIAPVCIRGFLALIRWSEGKLQKVPVFDLMGGALGVIIGLIIANLLNGAFISIPIVGPILAIILSLALGYLGLIIGARRKDDIFGFFARFARLRDKGDKGEKGEPARDGKNIALEQPKKNYKVLDTSVIIDGRIADIVQTGFIEGTLLIPGFVLEELRHIADSSDLLKRNRGRRGLDILNQMSKETLVNIEVYEQDFEDIVEVDSKLVRLGQVLGAPLLTNDYNLNKVAELQGVQVLNINELANAVKPVVLPGEEIYVQVVKEGKEQGQGVAYLDDGTMIVVDNGRRYIGQHITVLVTSVLQTAAGRMIFAKPKGAFEKKQVTLSSPEEVNMYG
ncbi:MAG: PIN/TRAM domain-containing protein [Peptococcaceae bacterium]|jgi:uncharacterized protein YacL|nr:PIN/TRAM domain-containing protein [Peptococcaceae bacterium]